MTHASIVSAFNVEAIGTKVLNSEKFTEVAQKAIAAFDFEGQDVPGQGFIFVPDAVPFVSAGVGRRTENASDFHAVLYRGRVELFLKRSCAAAVDGCALVVYTREAYLADPDVQADAKEQQRIEESDCTHVLVAILAFAGPKAPLSPVRFVHNLAGGNNEAATWTVEEIREKAVEVKSYDDTWCVVAD
ncbi:hypothetical protein KKG38_02030 [Patescibacteria group bacterium]|nr:hypothetical protein [Patescibacteria group bacterium]